METQPETAIIIRTRNESRWISEVLKRLLTQTYKDFEIIIVDSGSTDNTLEIASKFPVKIVGIPAESFTYPYAINVGIKNSNATTYYVILSAHSLPIDENWLQSGIDKFALFNKVLGVYGPLNALPESTLWDTLFYGTTHFLTRLSAFPKTFKVVKKEGAGVLGFTNAIIRRDLWEKYPINETFAGGGEDNNWCQHWLKEGYIAVKDIGFTVRHSHNLSLSGWLKQIKHWREVSEPTAFKYLTFRKDGSHTPR